MPRLLGCGRGGRQLCGWTLGTWGLQWLWLLFPCPLVPWGPWLEPGASFLAAGAGPWLAESHLMWTSGCREAPGFALLLLSSCSPSACCEGSTHRTRLRCPELAKLCEELRAGMGAGGHAGCRQSCACALQPGLCSAAPLYAETDEMGKRLCAACPGEKRTISGPVPLQP